jgi:SPP1 family predicted phage head-tail adaptor
MRAGRLRFRVKVEKRIEQTNTVGEPEIIGWQQLKTIWADIEPVRGEERMELVQTAGRVDVKTTTRAAVAGDITTKHRFVYKDRIFDIDANIDWRTRGIMREFFCKEAA